MNTREIKIAIVDDNIYFRKSLAEQIAQYKELKITSEVSDGKQLICSFSKEQPDLILLDLEMPIMNGVKTTEYLFKHHPNTLAS